MLDLVTFFVKIQLSSLYVKKQAARGLLSYFHSFAKAEERGTDLQRGQYMSNNILGKL